MKLYLVGDVSVMRTPLSRGGALGLRCGGGVLTCISNNTPLHPSQEGNRTARRFWVTHFIFSFAKHVLSRATSMQNGNNKAFKAPYVRGSGEANTALISDALSYKCDEEKKAILKNGNSGKHYK
jgi:hypothetical protein